jgi:ribosomal protein L30/L7E
MDLNELPGMTQKVSEYLERILNMGMENTVKDLVGIQG